MILDSKTAIVTGASGGIGRACAEVFAREGARVVVADINSDAGKAVASAIRDAGGKAEFCHCNVALAEDVAALMDATVRVFGTPDVLMNNAGIYRSHDFLDMTLAQFEEVIDVNLRSVFMLSQAVARRLVAEGRGGAIVNTSSVNSRMSSPGATAYSASKGGVNGFTAAAALALAGYGIRINAIAPGTIDTNQARGIHEQPQVMADTLSRIPLGRLGRPAEIAELACFLASEKASYITGQTIFADGGRNALSVIMPRTKA